MGEHSTTDYGGATVRTTDATPTAAAWLTVQNSKFYQIIADVVAINDLATKGASYRITGRYLVSPAGVITLVGSVTLADPAAAETDAGWDATLDISNATSGAAAGTGPYIRCLVTGAVGQNINWHASLDVKRVGLGGDKA